MKHVVIVGGGFGGVRAARLLSGIKDLSVTLISDQDCFRYYPALYRSTAGYSREQACIALSVMLHDCPNVTFKLGKATAVDKQQQTITLEDGEVVAYDEAIFALGVVTSYFGIPGIEQYSKGLKTIEELDELRTIIAKKVSEDAPTQKYIVIGAGPTGVEISASLKGYICRMLRKNPQSGQVSMELVEAAPRILPRLSKKAASIVERRLKKLGVKVLADTKVESEVADGILVNGQKMPADMVIWTAGVTNNPFFGANQEKFSISERGKVHVDECLQVAPHLYVIGDNADTPFSGVAMTAIRDAEYVTRRIVASMQNVTTPPYKQKQPIAVMPVGKRWAFIQWRRLIITGWLGHIIHWFSDLRLYAKIMPFKQAYKLCTEQPSEQDVNKSN